MNKLIFTKNIKKQLSSWKKKNIEKIFAGKAESYLAECAVGESFQLLRVGYYKTGKEDGRTVLHEITSLKDTYKAK